MIVDDVSDARRHMSTAEVIQPLSECIVVPHSFFFSSRRRHTRYWRDWSSDVCSSDLGVGGSLEEETPRRISLLSRLPVRNSAIPAVFRARRWKADSRATPLSFGSQRQSLGRPADWRCTPGNLRCATSHEEAGRLRRNSAGQQFVSGGIAERPKPLAQSRQLRR